MNPVRLVVIAAHMEARRPLAHLLERGEDVRALVTLTSEGLRKMSGADDLAELAEARGVPTLRVADVNHPESISAIQAAEPDLLLVIGWTRLISDTLLAVPRIATLGFHASLLPRYRGRAPVNWALINGESETGNTLMVLDPEADAGGIVAQRRIQITDDDDCATLYDKVGGTEVEMLDEVLGALHAGGSLRARPQDATLSTVMPKRRPEDGLIDWNRSRRDLFNWVRALTHPYPGAFTTLDGARLWIWKVAVPAEPSVDPDTEGTPAPGTAQRLNDGSVVVRVADGWLKLERVQFEGQDELGAAAATISSGSILGAEMVPT